MCFSSENSVALLESSKQLLFVMIILLPVLICACSMLFNASTYGLQDSSTNDLQERDWFNQQ